VNESQVVEAVAAARRAFRIDRCVDQNASAISLTGTKDAMKRFEPDVGVNVRGTFLCTQVLPACAEKSGELGPQSTF